MGDSVARQRSRIVWTVVIAFAVIVVAVVWLVFGYRPSADSAVGVPTRTPVPATPSVWPTPTPGSTAAMPKVTPTRAPIDDAVNLSGLETKVTSLARFEAKASSLPGEAGGPAIRVTVKVTNTTDKVARIDGARLSAAFGKSRAPGAELSGNGTREFPASIQPGETVQAVAAFSIPDGSDGSVHVGLDLVTGKPAIVFVGDVPKK